MAFTTQNELTVAGSAWRMQLLRYKVLEKRTGEIWKSFANAGFEPILIKGWAAAQVYTEPFRRESSDIDLMIAPAQFKEAEIFLKKLHAPYPVDLHKGARRHDTLSFEELRAASLPVACGDIKIRVPGGEDHLRILCVHWLTDGGAHRAKLWDIFYAVANRPPDFDWERLLQVVSPTRQRWVICTIGLAHKYLGLSLDETPFAAKDLNLPEWLIKTVEREWQSEVKLQPLPSFRVDRTGFIRQVRKRLPPNPIHATVDLEGEFDNKTRIGYQLQNFGRRLKVFLGRNRQKLKLNFGAKQAIE